MTYPGKVVNGVVEFDDGAALPDGTAVRVEPVEMPGDAAQESDEFVRQMLEIAGTAKGLPADLARNHDHYLHGHPKK